MQKQLDERTLVDGQITVEDIAELKAMGVTHIVNNRPDDEDVGQPSSDELEAAAEAAGLTYWHIPIARGMGPSSVEAMRDAIREAEAEGGKLFAFCRSGNRSTLAWAVAKSEDGTPREELERCAESAGFSLAPVAHLIRT